MNTISRESDFCERGQLAVTLVAKLEAAGIPAVYLRGHEDLPYDAGNDVDLLVPRGQREHAADLIIANCTAMGWQVVAKIEFSPLAVVLANVESGELLHIDLFDRIEWHALEFADSKILIQRRKWNGTVHIPEHSDELYLNLVTRLLYECKIRDKHREQAQGFAGSFHDITAAFCRHLGAKGADIATQLKVSNWKGSVGVRQTMIKAALMRYAIRTPTRFISGISRFVFRSAYKLIRPPGLFIVLEGADGVGKSTIMRSFVPWTSSLCGGRTAARFHWKPIKVEYDEPSSTGTVDPRGGSPRSLPISILFLIYHLLGYWYGWVFHIYPKIIACRPVIGDRYSYDLYLDPKRFRLNLPNRLCRIVAFLTPQPDAVVFLKADPETIVARKPELSLNEIKAYQEKWDQLSSGRPHFMTVDASENAESVTHRVKHVILSHLGCASIKP
jgi:thymidylate kinase